MFLTWHKNSPSVIKVETNIGFLTQFSLQIPLLSTINMCTENIFLRDFLLMDGQEILLMFAFLPNSCGMSVNDIQKINATIIEIHFQLRCAG